MMRKPAAGCPADPLPAMVPCSSKERRQAVLDKKLRLKKNYDVIVDLTAMWEELRKRDTPAERRAQLVNQLVARMEGRLPTLAHSHTASRVVQACIKYGSPANRASIMAALKPNLVDLARSPHGRFVVSKLIGSATKQQIPGESWEGWSAKVAARVGGVPGCAAPGSRRGR